MPRRRSNKGNATKSKPKPLNRGDAKQKKWNTRGDIDLDEEDQFHDSRDKILLEGNDGEYDDDGDEDEVFALKGLDNDSDQGEYDYSNAEEANEGTKEVPSKRKPKMGKKGKGKKKEDKNSEEEEEEEDEEGWGRGRAAYYSSNADLLDSDDEEGNELEEQEAKRLQAKAREELTEDDFGLADSPELEKRTESDEFLEPVPSALPALGTDKQSLLRHLEKSNPEALALARDWDDTARNLEKTRQRIEKIESEDPDNLSLGMIHLYYQALLSYSTILAFYLHLRSSTKYALRPALLQSHPILQRLLTLKQALQTLEDFDFAGTDLEDDDEDEYGYMGMDGWEDGDILSKADFDEDIDSDELADLLDDAKQSAEATQIPVSKAKKPPKKKCRTEDEKGAGLVKPVFDLVEPDFAPSKAASRRLQVVDDLEDTYGEAMALHSVDAADKTARKKSLRFYTSKIDSASTRRQGARNQAAGGDDDIPYRERKKERDARLVKEAAIRAKNEFGEALNDEEPEPQVGDKRSREEDDEGEASPDEYYELVKKRSKEEKAKKKAEYEEAHDSARVPLDEGEASGPRSLTRAILANKGLTPRRPKSVRNPRVKKREKYEKAKKKIASQKAVYKGGLTETAGKYGGEKSGITKVVKSVQLG
ncbi:Sas10 C-terminal domain-containing protein [Gymnopilus junonius]|uniref:Sas10 C-terminal domain-containing protein n=1 Tax=Gymnopilus junonius TaxID=109634 RepID=A0A9P5NW96_GYMJU|nr:Sas10 C-terminal domain-containing protein [Gymnopilus junonius]